MYEPLVRDESFEWFRARTHMTSNPHGREWDPIELFQELELQSSEHDNQKKQLFTEITTQLMIRMKFASRCVQ